jgi:hypothetical protein
MRIAERHGTLESVSSRDDAQLEQLDGGLVSDPRGSGDVGTQTIDLGPIAITFAIDAGPRILGYARHGGPQLFVSLLDEVIEHPAVGTYRFLGGHRLWRAPEVPAITYAPDDTPVESTVTDDGFEVIGPLGADAIVKAIAVTQHGDLTIVDHELRNEGWTPVRCAPWAITQLVPGGTAYLPQQRGPADEDGVLPNRHIVLWPYTDLSAREVTIGQKQVTVYASDRPSKSKVGLPNRLGWIAYALGGELFVKWSALHRDSELYVDRGVSVECYRDERFIEMETLGPLVTLQPGKRAVHREIWMLRDVAADSISDVLDSLPAEPEVPGL